MIITHDRRIDIDWYQPDPYSPKVMLSWQVESCDCETPWHHY